MAGCYHYFTIYSSGLEESGWTAQAGGGRAEHQRHRKPTEGGTQCSQTFRMKTTGAEKDRRKLGNKEVSGRKIKRQRREQRGLNECKGYNNEVR